MADDENEIEMRDAEAIEEEHMQYGHGGMSPILFLSDTATDC